MWVSFSWARHISRARWRARLWHRSKHRRTHPAHAGTSLQQCGAHCSADAPVGTEHQHLAASHARALRGGRKRVHVPACACAVHRMRARDEHAFGGASGAERGREQPRTPAARQRRAACHRRARSRHTSPAATRHCGTSRRCQHCAVPICVPACGRVSGADISCRRIRTDIKYFARMRCHISARPHLRRGGGQVRQG